MTAVGVIPVHPVDETHDPGLRSWVDSANAGDTDFPLQNLPFGRFRSDAGAPWRLGVAIGDQVLDLRAAGLVDHADAGALLRLALPERRALRLALSRGLRAGSDEQPRWAAALAPQAEVQLGLPCDSRDYTDFYAGIHHALAVGRQFRSEQPLLPNYKWVPVGYHGRASTLLPSGHDFHRPWGQCKPPGDAAPQLAPSARLDFELELGAVVGRPSTLGQPVPVAAAESHLFGLVLLNDWSARDLQTWEYQPLGPFLAKSFATTLSPWLVTLEALAPFRCAPTPRPPGDPAPLPYLQQGAAGAGAFDIDLAVWLQTAAMRRAGHAGDCIARSNFAAAAYWTLAQLLAHQTVNGCRVAEGDLLGSGTLSGPRPEQAGSLLELTQGGRVPLTLSNGETRTFLQDGDAVTLRARCQAPGARAIGFGTCHATVLPAQPLTATA